MASIAPHRIGQPRATAIVGGLLIVATAGSARAATIVVPTDQPTIQAAIDAAGRGDTVVIQPGDYVETIGIGPGHDGVTLTAADPENPPRIVAPLRGRAPAIRIEHANDVTIDAIRVRGVAEAVRVANARGVRLLRLGIESVGAGIRLQRVTRAEIDECTVLGTDHGPGLRVDASRDVVVTDTRVEDTQREGVLVRRSISVALVRTAAVGARGRGGIVLVGVPDAMLSGCDARANTRDGVHVQRSAGLDVQHTRAEANGDTGLRVERSRPIFAVDDVVARGNHARANGRHDILVTPPRCGRRPCPRPSTTTRPTTSTTTTVTTTTVPTVPPSVPTTTSMTTTTGPLAAAPWRFYVRITDADGGHRDVYVPYRAIDPAIVVGIRPSDLGAFRVDDQVSAAEIAALGGDTLARFENAARGYVATNPADYPGAAGVVSLRWAKRDS